MIGRIKQVLVILAAALSGYAVGVYSVATRVPRDPMNIMGEMPPWFLAAEGVYLAAAGGAATCAIAWVYVDYKYVVSA